MISQLGTFILVVTMVVALGAMLLGIVAARTRVNLWLSAARGMTIFAASLVLVSAGLLLQAMLTSDFRIEYVARYTERALPSGYKFAAFWAGQEGSLLLWTVLVTGLSVVLVVSKRHDKGVEPAATLATLAAVIAFFAGLLLFAANPFKAVEVVPADGSGLNPLLQDPGMIIHPPLLFLGYAGYTLPFALLVGAMAAGRTDDAWLASVRRYNLFAWFFLSAGILWGGHWSYTTLGWGGYWAWDPVENASLLPWLTGTALLHSTHVQMQRGLFKRWNFLLIAGTFILCLFGTYVTRSGVISSVHAFGESPIGNFFAGLIGVTLVLSLFFFVTRHRELQPAHKLEHLLGREGAFLAANVMLTLIMLVTLVGTVLPALTRWTSGREVTVGANYYNHVAAPIALLLVALMAMGPILRYGVDAVERLLRAATGPLIFALLVAGSTWALGVNNAWALVGLFIVALVFGVIASELGKSVLQRSRAHDEILFVALVNQIDANHRRYGAQLAHLGLALIVLGIIGSSLFSSKQSHQIAPGNTLQIGDYTIKFNGLKEEVHGNYTAVVADLTLTQPSGAMESLRPTRRFYNKSEDAYSEVALRSSLREDLYITLAGWEADGSATAIQSIVNPLVNWIWIGGIVMVTGAALCMLPRLLRRPVPSAEKVEAHPQPAPRASAASAVRRDRRKTVPATASRSSR